MPELKGIFRSPWALKIHYEKFSLVGQQLQRYCQKIFIQNGLEIVIFEIFLLSLELSLRNCLHGALQLIMPIPTWFRKTEKYFKKELWGFFSVCLGVFRIFFFFFLNREYCPISCKMGEVLGENKGNVRIGNVPSFCLLSTCKNVCM